MEMQMDTETNLADVPEVEGVVTEEGVGSTEFEEAANPDEEAGDDEPETVEVEHDGKTFKVPPELKDAFLRQADYTRKTQALADRGKELDAQFERVQQASEAEIEARASKVAIQAAIQQYDGVDWDAVESQDPATAASHWRRYQQLVAALGEADKQIDTTRQQLEAETQQESAKRIEQGLAELHRDIPDWGPELANKLMDFGERQFGLDRQTMENVTDPRWVKVINAAFNASKPQPKSVAQTAQPIKPASKVKGGNPAVSGLDDRLSAEEWVKRRNEQTRK